MKVLKFLAEAVAYTASIAVSLVIIGFALYLLNQHVTCSSLVNWCVVH